MNIGILSKHSHKLTKNIKNYFESQGHKVEIYTSDNLYIENSLLKNDFYILKSKKPLYLYAAQYLKANGIPVIPDPQNAYKQRNRMEAHFLIKKAGLKAPKYYIGTKNTLIKNIKSEEYPLIIKPMMGSGGEGIRIIKSINDFSPKNNKLIYIQQYIIGTHYNICFIGDEICTCVKPPLCPNDKDMDMIPTTDDIAEAVIRWKKTHNILFGHLDIVREKATDDLYIVDPGAFPQFTNWKYDKDPAPKICDLILSRLKLINSKK